VLDLVVREHRVQHVRRELTPGFSVIMITFSAILTDFRKNYDFILKH
jgi:hypothetical protein